MEQQPKNAGVIAPPPFIFLGGLAIGVILSLIFRIDFMAPAARLLLGLLLLAVGLFGFFLAANTMLRAGTPLNPEETVKKLVTSGPYRFTRNPIYLSFSLVYLGLSLLLNSVWAILLFPFVFFIIDQGVIAREEKYLEQKFGPIYLEYRTAVRRWI